MLAARWVLLAVATSTTACAGAGETSSGRDSAGGVDASGGAPAGEVGGGGGSLAECTATQAVSVADRSLIGGASPYPGDGGLRAREAELLASPAARRAAAWQAVARALTSVRIAASLPGVPDATLARWQTWYGKDDIARLFHRLYEGVGPERRAMRDAFSDPELDAAFAWNPHAVEDDAAWPADRLAAYVATLDTAEEVAALGGIARSAYSPGATRHLLRSYGAIVGCDGAAPPDAVIDGPQEGTRRVVRELADMARCERRAWGPYFVGEGEELIAEAEGAQLSLIGDDAAELASCAAGAPCRAGGPRAVHVVATATADGAVAVNVDYREANPAWASCLDGAFPLDAAVVKADWRRVWPGEPLPTFDTSPEALATRRDGDASWTEPDGTAEPGPESILTVTTPNGASFRLAGLHLMTKDLDHWMWITLWWSPRPDEDLGADRPASIAALPGPWRHYAMCVVTSFDEADGSPSWCSNPYIEQGAHNAGSNCIGCHQHGGTGLLSGSILEGFPDHGASALRNNFPGDYAWSLDAGDMLLRLFADEVAWWDTE